MPPVQHRPGPDPLSRRTLLRAATVTAGAAVLGTPTGHAVAAPAPVDAVARIDSTAPGTRMEGFGASGAWWPQDLIHFDREVQEQVGELLFGADGIGLSVYRYNIGGGGVGADHPKNPETFLLGPGVYDWDRDRAGRRFLRMAHRHRVPVLIGFANSAPTVWTTNGRNKGGALIEGAEAAYGRYLTDVVAHFREADGISLSYLSPMNEPAFDFGENNQEGMAVPVTQRAALVRAVGQALADRTPHCRVVADESNQITAHVLEEVPQWLGAPGIRRHVAAVAHHAYDYAEGEPLRRIRHEIGERFSVPTWMTEVSCYNGSGFGPGYDPTMENALWLANRVWHDVAVAGDSAWHWWLALSGFLGTDPAGDPDSPYRVNDQGWNDGLISYDPNHRTNGNQRLYLTKRYWALGNFSRHVRPGAIRHDVLDVPEGLRVLAFTEHGSDDAGWVLVVINNDTARRELRLDLPAARVRGMRPAHAYETSEDKDLTPVTLPGLRPDGRFTATVVGRSVTTYLLRRSARPHHAPGADLSVDTPGGLLLPGTTAEITTTCTNYGSTPLRAGTHSLEVPKGWTARPATATRFAVLPPGRTTSVTWRLTPPPDAVPGATPLRGRLDHQGGQEHATVQVTVPNQPPTNDTYLSDLDWYQAVNGVGPVERDRSNGEGPAGDGAPLRINGKVYEKGLGTHAHSEIRYYLGGNARRFLATVGVDDNIQSPWVASTLAFQVFGDGKKLYDSGVMRVTDAARPLDIDVTGVDVLHLVVTNGGDLIAFDRGDWAEARVIV